MSNAIQIDRATLPNITRAEFEAQVERTCRKYGVARHTDFDTTCRSLAVELFCLGKPCSLLAIYLSAACNVKFAGEP